jgi:hypothetical protein
MIRSLAARNALSALLFVVAVIGFFVQLRIVREGIVTPETRLQLVAYILIAIYALAAIAVRVRASGKPRR